jgi:hypothetical protein
MRTAVLGALMGAGLVIAAAAAAPERSNLLGQRGATSPAVGAGGEMVAFSCVVGDRYQQVTVLDPKLKALSVYHIELATGNVKLCCVRNIHWDLQMMHYNGDRPLPRDIQSLLEPK